MKRFTVLLIILGMVSISQAEMLADFETGLDGFSAQGTPASTLSTSTNPLAVTSGSQCLKVLHGPSNFWPIRWTASTMPTRMRKLRMDVTFVASEWAGQWSRFNQKINLHFGPVGPAYVETPDTTTANWKFRNSTAVCPTEWGSWLGDEQATFTIDLSSFNSNLAGNTEFWINFSMNSSGACPYYIDQLRWVDEPYNPAPANGGVGVIGTTLSWGNSTDSLNGINVWFGIPPEPNENDPNTILSLDTYKTLLTNIYSKSNPGATSSCPMPSGLIDGTKYTWCVDSEPNNFPMPFWTFTATTNNPPVANAGADQYIYNYADPNNIVITLNGSATDDGKVSPLTYAWTQTDGPAATINSPSAAITTVTLTGGLANLTEAGSAAPYVFHMVANDGQFTGEDDITVFVNSSSCTASIEAGGFYFFGDIASATTAGVPDCKVDLYDFAELALNWLGCTDTFEGCN
jgi:hypothetical protein